MSYWHCCSACAGVREAAASVEAALKEIYSKADDERGEQEERRVYSTLYDGRMRLQRALALSCPTARDVLHVGSLCPDHSEPLILLCAECVRRVGPAAPQCAFVSGAVAPGERCIRYAGHRGPHRIDSVAEARIIAERRVAPTEER